MQADTEFARLLKARIAAGTAYADACQALADYHRTEASVTKREVKADPATLNRVRDSIERLFRQTGHIEATSEQLAMRLSRFVAHLPESKTLQNVYLPIIRETCPHAVQSGRTWLWFKGAAAGRVTRETDKAGNSAFGYP